jgi:antitoxin (DNA-binding transcriptional repressor) of toxin-antitoxin stability system
MNTLSIDIAGKEWHNILQDVLMGIPSVITQAGKPIAEIKPLKSKRTKPVFGCARGQIEVSEDFDSPLNHFEGVKQ